MRLSVRFWTRPESRTNLYTRNSIFLQFGSQGGLPCGHHGVPQFRFGKLDRCSRANHRIGKTRAFYVIPMRNNGSVSLSAGKQKYRPAGMDSRCDVDVHLNMLITAARK